MTLSRRFHDLHQRYGNGDMKRRDFLRSIGTMAMASGLSGAALLSFIAPARAGSAVRFDSWGGVAQTSMAKLILDPLAKQMGITVNQGQFGSEAELLARIGAEGLGGYNFFTAGNPTTCLMFASRGYVQELDETKIPRLKDIMPRALDAYRHLLPSGKLAAVPYFTTGVAIAYNTTKINAADVEKEGFNILLDPRYAQQIACEDQWQRRICYAALQTGQDINNIKNMQLVWETIAKSKHNAFKFWRTASEQVQLISSGDAWICEAWLAPIGQMTKAGIPIAYYPKSGTFANFASLVVLKGTPMDVAYEMMDILLRPEVQIEQARASRNVTLLNPQSVPLPDDVKQLPGFDPTGTLANFRTLDAAYWNANAAAWEREYRRVISRG